MSLEIGKPQAKKKTPRLGEGTYMARISSVVDLGIQPMTDWQTQEPVEPKPRVMLTWTLPTETMERELEDGSTETLPRLLSKEYTISNHEKSNIVKLVATLKPGLKVLTELLDLECMVSVGSTVNDNDKITNVVKSPKGMSIDELERDPVTFDYDSPEEEAYLSLPFWMQGKLKEAINYNGFADGWGEQESAG